MLMLVLLVDADVDADAAVCVGLGPPLVFVFLGSAILRPWPEVPPLRLSGATMW